MSMSKYIKGEAQPFPKQRRERDEFNKESIISNGN